MCHTAGWILIFTGMTCVCAKIEVSLEKHVMKYVFTQVEVFR